jgi:hypothetical protein
MLREGLTWKFIETERSKLIQELQGPAGKEGGRTSKLEIIKQNISNNTDAAKPLETQGTKGFAQKKPAAANAPKKQRAPRANDRIAEKVDLGSGKTFERGENAGNQLSLNSLCNQNRTGGMNLSFRLLREMSVINYRSTVSAILFTHRRQPSL